MFTQTGTIGLSVLISSLRLQENQVIYIESEGDSDVILPSYNSHDLLQMELHPDKVRKVYINEKNKYGIRPVLQKNALLLFLYLHFCNPDENGLVRMVDTEHAAFHLHCSVRTIKNNLMLLAKAGYIAYSSVPDVPYHYNVFLLEYKSYFLKAYQGGRGFVTFTKNFFYSLTELTSVNSVRLAIRMALPYQKNYEQIVGSEQPYNRIKRVLPKYITKKKVRQILESPNFDEIFSVAAKKYTASIIIKDKYDQAGIRDLIYSQAADQLKMFLEKFNSTLSDGNEHFIIKQKDMTDIAQIAWRSPIWAIEKAMTWIYQHYIALHIPIDHMGALVRSITARYVDNSLSVA